MESKQEWIVSCLVIVAVSIGVCVLTAYLGLEAIFSVFQDNSPEGQAARATETVLTQAHETEARSAIHSFINTFWSLDVWQNPDLLAQVFTGQELEYRHKIFTSHGPLKTYMIIASTTINELRVIEYSPTQFKAFSCEELNYEDVTARGAFVDSINLQYFDRIYVFNRENGVWKVAAWADFTDRDDLYTAWGYYSYPKWQQDLIGDLPHLLDMYDPCY